MKNLLRKTGMAYLLVVVILFALPQAAKSQVESSSQKHQYLFDRFARGIVNKKSGISVEAVLNYNCLTEEMVFIQDGRRLALDNLVSIVTVDLQDRTFIPFGEVFYELVITGPAIFYIQHKSKADFDGENVGYGGTSQLSNVKTVSSMRSDGQFFYMDVPDNIQIKATPVYWIEKEGEMYQFYNRRSFIKIFPEYREQLKSHMKDNKVDFESRSDLIELVKYTNGLISRLSGFHYRKHFFCRIHDKNKMQ